MRGAGVGRTTIAVTALIPLTTDSVTAYLTVIVAGLRMTDELDSALEAIRQLRQELELTRKMLDACERSRVRLDKRVNDLLADLTAITKMDGKE